MRSLRPLIVATLVGTVASGVLPHPEWLRYISGGLWAVTFFVFSWWIPSCYRRGLITRLSVDVAAHFWVLAGISTYASLYAAIHHYPVSPYIWVTSAVLCSLIYRMLATRTDQHERHGDFLS